MPTGHYDLECSVDLRPFYGRLEQNKKAYIEKPDRNVLERYLTDLESADRSVRITAAGHLAWFPEDAETVVPVLVALIDDADQAIREQAITSLGSYPKAVAEHWQTLAGVARGGGRITPYERMQAVFLLGRFGPVEDRVEKLLRDLAASKDESVRGLAGHALRIYVERTSD